MLKELRITIPELPCVKVKTISPEEALKLVNENKCNLIDIRDAFELQREGSVENSFHIPRGLLEFSIHPDSTFS